MLCVRVRIEKRGRETNSLAPRPRLHQHRSQLRQPPSSPPLPTRSYTYTHTHTFTLLKIQVHSRPNDPAALFLSTVSACTMIGCFHVEEVSTCLSPSTLYNHQHPTGPPTLYTKY
mmetsp:Transcript_32842/g.65047  ORF Transcript_32842/g.65047 Transcript_32842/m.65047 type:complete len:115 (-) Transcript_32842:51-395(-)